MKNRIITFLFIYIPLIAIGSEIDLPEINLSIIDNRSFEITVSGIEGSIPELELNILPEPDFTEDIKVDLEQILPDISENIENRKKVNAQVEVGYGLNNELFLSMALFLTEANPQISLTYLRSTYDRNRIELANDFSSRSSIDHITAGIITEYNRFNLYANFEFFNKSYGLQNLSEHFAAQTKRIITTSITPTLNFNFQNQLNYKLDVAAVMIENQPVSSSINSLNQFEVLLRNEIAYSQVFGDNHIFQVSAGHNFAYINSSLNDSMLYFTGDTSNIFYNEIATKASYRTVLAESFMIIGEIDIRLLFIDTEFFWYINPYTKFEYNYEEYFSCFIEGGSIINERPDEKFIIKNDYTTISHRVNPGYRWFAKTGLSGSLVEWFKLTTDFEYAFNMNGLDYEVQSDNIRLASIYNREFHEINLEASFLFTFKGVFNIKAEWKHFFLDRTAYTGQDQLNLEIKTIFKTIGIEFYADATLDFNTIDHNRNSTGHKFMIGTGFTFSNGESFAIGIRLNNIGYFQEQKTIGGYNDRGINGIAYIKIGF